MRHNNMAYWCSHNIIPYWLFLIQTYLLLLLVAGSKPGQKIPAVIVFGDSSVDSGNNNFIPTIARSNFMPYGRDFFGGFPTGRFCNGRLPPDFISEAVGLKPLVPAYLDPAYNISDFSYGVCFASAGTGFDNATSNVLGVIPLWKEVEFYKEYQKKLRDYLGDEKAQVIISEALYLVSIGTNDFLENYYSSPEKQKQLTVSQYEDFLIGLAWNFVKDLYFLGARKISLAGLPPMGCLPLQRATNIMQDHACAEDKNSVAREFNMKLITLVANLNNYFPGLQLVYSDAYTVFLDIITSPSKYGFEVANYGCCGTGRFEMSFLCNKHNPFTCPDANKYVFWDAFHPSEKTDQIISYNLLKTSLAKFV
ncbi:GDSL esterase/lipase At2g42990-like [Humulus lupulus]|uniref:GDSL esterase/lipase At2g42990-like n=1 Tax=Humulus lupulus TaxID=3486 RepID=UPI002B40C09E|nr:GDSL esterase/lipase At2g42990-like [Humulus lupulus]